MMVELADHVQHAQKSKKNLQQLLVAAYRALPDGTHRQIESIPGIGELTAAVLVAKIVSIDRFPSPGSLVGYFGVFPEANDSGVDRYGNPKPQGTRKMCQKGNDLVRAYLWNAARVALRHNPAVRALYRRLRQKTSRGPQRGCSPRKESGHRGRFQHSPAPRASQSAATVDCGNAAVRHHDTAARID